LSVQPKHVAYVDGTNKICCGCRKYIYQFLIYFTTGWTQSRVVIDLLTGQHPEATFVGNGAEQ